MVLDRSRIEEIILAAVTTANQSRAEGQRLEVSPTARLFGGSSALDSLGLVGLLIDIEEAFDREGSTIVLSDERAMAQSRSPFRDVPSLVDYIAALLAEQKT
jgi:acyl carrier protein